MPESTPAAARPPAPCQVLLKGVAISSPGVPTQALSRTSSGFWVIDSPEEAIPLRPPFTLTLLGVNNQRLTTSLATLRAQDLGIQF